MSKSKVITIDDTPGGDTVKEAVNKLDSELDVLYTYINALYRLQGSDSAPTDLNNYDVWFDPLTQARLMYYSTANAAWVPLTWGLPIGLFHAYSAAAALSVPSGTATPMVPATEVVDTAGWYNTTTGRYTPQLAGWYELNASFEATNPDTAIGSISVAIRKNAGGTLLASNKGIFHPNAIGVSSCKVSGIIVELNGTTDYVYAGAGQTNPAASSANNTASDNFSTAFWGRYLGASQTGSLQ